ncbi:MAG: hypothetical protein ABWZ80_02985, partial [Beijerinckiaceae bacterium]
PGTELAFEKDVEADRALGFLPRRKIPSSVARFRQLNMDQPHTHHDALEFPDGATIFVTQLSIGQRATVLQLPAESQSESATPAVERATPRPMPILGVW